jgi:hypothetical protein
MDRRARIMRTSAARVSRGCASSPPARRHPEIAKRYERAYELEATARAGFFVESLTLQIGRSRERSQLRFTGRIYIDAKSPQGDDARYPVSSSRVPRRFRMHGLAAFTRASFIADFEY